MCVPETAEKQMSRQSVSAFLIEHVYNQTGLNKSYCFANFSVYLLLPYAAFLRPILYLQMYYIFVTNNHKKLFEIFLTQMANT